MLPLYLQETTVAGFELRFEATKNLMAVRDIFDSVTSSQTYDVAEMSMAEYLIRSHLHALDYVGLPVFPSRAFRSSSVFVRTDRIREPQHLSSSRIGVPLYGMTAAVFARGFLSDEYAVTFHDSEWVQGAMNSQGQHGSPGLPTLTRPIRIKQNSSDLSLSQLLEKGDIDATLGALVPDAYGHSARIERLFPNYRVIEKEYFKRTQIFPIMHLIVIRKRTVEEFPEVVQSLYDAFCRSKAIALDRMRETATLQYMLPWLSAHVEEIDDIFEGDPWRYGCKHNASTLDALSGYLFEQGFTEDVVNWRALLKHVDENVC